MEHIDSYLEGNLSYDNLIKHLFVLKLTTKKEDMESVIKNFIEVLEEAGRFDNLKELLKNKTNVA